MERIRRMIKKAYVLTRPPQRIEMRGFPGEAAVLNVASVQSRITRHVFGERSENKAWAEEHSDAPGPGG